MPATTPGETETERKVNLAGDWYQIASSFASKALLFAIFAAWVYGAVVYEDAVTSGDREAQQWGLAMIRDVTIWYIIGEAIRKGCLYISNGLVGFNRGGTIPDDT